MSLYETVSGSLYEVDEVNKRARRVRVPAACIKHTLSDGEWHTYESLDTNYAGGLLFVWPAGSAHNYTLTSRVVKQNAQGVSVWG